MVKTKTILIYKEDYKKIRQIREDTVMKTLETKTFADVIHDLLEQ